MKSKHWAVSLGSCLSVLLLAACASTPKDGRPLDPQADEVLRQMSDTLGGADKLRFKMRLKDEDVLVDGRLVRCTTERIIVLDRPDRLAVELRGDAALRHVWFDRGTLVSLDVDRPAFARTALSREVEPALEDLREDYQVALPALDLLRPDPREAILADTRILRHLGKVPFEGYLCHQLRIERTDVDWDLWVDTGNALPRRLRIHFRDDPQHPPYDARFYDWDLQAKVSDYDFTPQIPDQAYEVEMLDVTGLP
jgi:hypothetical protein